MYITVVAVATVTLQNTQTFNQIWLRKMVDQDTTDPVIFSMQCNFTTKTKLKSLKKTN